jgi:hypothetical protein
MDFSKHLTLFAAAIALASAAQAGTPTVPAAHVGFSGEVASDQVRAIADWAMASGDHQDLPFVVVDKVAAKLFLFDRHGTLRAATAVLLGLAQGDVSPPGIGDRKLSQIKPAERITPAGRFVADTGVNLSGQDIIWVDYAAAIAIHRATDVKPGLTARDRLARLASPSPRDRRISHGCINVSPTFYDAFLRPAFAQSSGIVYILPETKALAAVFAIPAASSAG